MANYGIDIALTVTGQNKLAEVEKQISALAQAAQKVTTFEVSGATKQTTSELEKQRKLYQESGKARKEALILANRELEVEKKINDRLAARVKLDQKRKDFAKRAESVALGVGFPLLFGGGAGAVAGGLAGSFVGQGFGGQILLSALGQQFDAFAADIAELGMALDPLTADIDKIIEKTGLLGTETGKYITEIDELGYSTEALEAATTQLAAVIGQDGVDALKEFGDAAQDFQNEWSTAMTQMGVALATFLGPALAGITNLLEGANALRAASASDDAQLQELSRSYEASRRGLLFGGKTPQEQEAILEQIKERIKEINDEEADRLKIQAEQLRNQKEQEKQAKKAAELAEKNRQIAERQLADAEMVRYLKSKEYELALANTKEDEISLKFALDKAKLIAQYTEDIEKARSESEKAFIQDTLAYDLAILRTKELKAQNDLTDERLKKEKEIQDIIKETLQILPSETTPDADETFFFTEATAYAKELKEELDELVAPITLVQDSAAAIGTAFSDAFRTAMTEATNAQEVLAAFFDSLANSFIDMAARMIDAAIDMMAFDILSSIFLPTTGFTGGISSGLTAPSGGGFPGLEVGGSANTSLGGVVLPGMANGGAVSAGSSYIVGEQGPELFMPRTSGSIYPNDTLGGMGSNVVVNVDASGSSIQGDSTQANMLGQALGAAVQAELIKQKRPGGLLA